MTGRRFLLAACLAAAALAPRAAPAVEATTYDARVSVFKQGTSTSRASGSLIGVWNFTGKTFTVDSNWEWESPAFPFTSLAAISDVAIWKKEPTAFAAASGYGRLYTWSGTTWKDHGAVHSTYATRDLDVYNSTFAVAAFRHHAFYRWTGTTWLSEGGDYVATWNNLHFPSFPLIRA